MTDAPALLGAYAAKTCARRVHNDHDPTMTGLRGTPTVDLSARLEAGREFDAAVRAALGAALGPVQVPSAGPAYVDLTDLRGTRADRIAATLAALRAGTPVVAGGQLPDDLAGRRTGRPDLLVRTGGSGYLPVEIKGHRVLRDSTTGGAVVTTAPDLDPVACYVLDRSLGLGSADDLVQLAHYWRMLEACGLEAAQPMAGVIGTDCLGDGVTVVWHDLDDPRFWTYSRSQGSACRTALERYDHEFAFRLEVVDVACRRSGTDTDPAPLVVPVWQEWCGGCDWNAACRAELEGTLGLELLPTALDIREWRALAALGLRTAQDLAPLDLDDPVLEPYWGEVTHRQDPRGRLAKVIERASMVLDGEVVRRTGSEPLDVPSGVIEVDFDVEWSADERVYLWGLLVARPDAEPVFEPVVSWDHLDDASESALAREVVDRFRALRAEAASAGGALRVYHYTNAELTQMRRIARRADPGGITDADLDDVATDFVDLYSVVKDQFLGTRGLGLKMVAQYAAGFRWRDDDPGGLQSQQWWLEAVTAQDPDVRRDAIARVLAYNEDDVLATYHLRRWLRTLD